MTSQAMTTGPSRARSSPESGVALIQSGVAAFAARAKAARAAQSSLDLQYYIWRNDLTGRILAREVLKAAERGVRVRLLLDDMYAIGGERRLAALDAHPNIEVRLFNATHWRRFGRLGFLLEMAFGGWHLNHRMHNKAWIADGQATICGGRNIGNEYFDASEEFNFRDIDLVIAGPAAHKAQAVFDQYWNHPLAQPVGIVSPEPRGRPSSLVHLAARMDAAGLSPASRPFFEGLRADRAFASVIARNMSGLTLIPTEDIHIVADPPGKASGDADPAECLVDIILSSLRGATREALLISPYFVPGKVATDLLEALARRGVRVSVVTNSLAATDVVAVHGGYARYRNRLLKAGVALYELKRSGEEAGSVFGSRGASLHTKAMLIDGERVFIGSYNLDPRSAMLNTEMGTFVTHPVMAEQLRKEHARLVEPARSWRVTRGTNGGLVWTAEIEGRITTRHAEPDASLLRRILARVLRWKPIESQL